MVRRKKGIGRDGRPLTAAMMHSPRGEVSPMRGKTYDKDTLTPAEVDQLVGQCSRRGASGSRNRALISTLYRAALRLSECLALRWKDIDWKGGKVAVCHGKGDKMRTTFLHNDALYALQLWRDRRKVDGIGKGGQLIFCTLEGRPVAPEYVRKMLKRLAAKAGITKRVHPHGLRRAAAVSMMDATKDLRAVSAHLGHRSLQTTQVYLGPFNADMVRDAAERSDW